MAEAIELSASDTVSMNLSGEYLSDLLDLLSGAADKWEIIARFLPNLSQKSISVVKAKSCDADVKLFEIMTRWLNEAHPQPTVKDLVDALRSPFLSQNKIASEIEKKFSQVSLQKSVSLTAADHKSTSSAASYNRFESSPAKFAEDATTSSEACTYINQSSKPSGQHSLDQDSGVCAYECGCIEKCNIIDIMSGKCPAPKSTTSHFPLVNAQNLSKNDKDLLCGHLRRQFQQISKKYSKLVQSIKKSLKSQGVKAMELTDMLRDLQGYIPHRKKAGHLLLQDRIQEMEKVETTDAVFRILSDYCSFFNHDIIKYIVDEVGTDADKASLEEYQTYFTEYCKRSVFECPFSICCDKPSSHFSMLVMKVVSDSMTKPYSMEAVQLFQAEVSSLLYITKYTLKLCSVEEGCLQLKFQIPQFLSSILFPLSADQVKGLKDLGVTKVECDGASQLLESVFPSQGNYYEKSIKSQPLHQNLIEEENSEACEQAIYEKQEGDAHFKRAEYQLAVESYTKAMKLDPSSALIATSKGAALFKQGLYKDAEECCYLSLKLDQCNSEAYLIRARTRNMLGNLEDAVNDFSTALKLDPSNHKAMTEMARLEGELRRRAKSKQDKTKRGTTESDLASSECTGEVCKLPHKPLSELEVVKILDEWESLRALIGEKVFVSSNVSQEVPISTFEMEGTVIGLFFSGIWCPPSRVFTPELITWYNNFKKGPNGHLLDIIFISSDEDEASWKEYSAKMPWYGIHFNDEKRKRILHNKYNIEWIPTLIFVDGKTGKVISENGESIIEDDPTGDRFPWKPKPFSEIVIGAKFTDHDEKERTWEQLQGKVIGLFFSNYSNVPGIEFTFQLVETYNKLKQANKEFEIIYVSFDHNREEWKGYSALMPWISLPYEDARTEDLKKLFQVDDSEIPKLILLDEKCGLITTKGYTCVHSDPNGENFPWYVNMLTKFGSDDLVKSAPARLIWFVPSSLKKNVYKVLRPIAKEYISKKAEENMKVKLRFFIASEENEASEAIRNFADLPSAVPLLTILDIAHKQVHVSDANDVTEENARKFVYAYLKKQLLGRSLKL